MITMEAEEMQDNMGISDKVGGGDQWWTIVMADMWYNRVIRDVDTEKWIFQ